MKFHGLCTAFFTIVTAASSIDVNSCQSLLISGSFLASTRGRAVEVAPPRAAIFIALGHDSKTSPLEEFAQNLASELRRRVVTYRRFTDGYYIFAAEKWWDGPRERTTSLVEQAIRRAVKLYPHTKIIAFNLDGYDPQDLFRPVDQEVSYYTNFEVRLLLCDGSLYQATRWYRNGSELTSEEAEKFWTPIRLRDLCRI